MKKRIQEIDMLKGIAILLVILGHSIIKYPINLHEINYCNLLYEFIIVVQMPLFFIVSGYCYSNKSGYKDYLKKKFWRIVVPYIVFNFIEIIPRIFAKQFINGNSDIFTLLFNLVFKGGNLWFLYTLMEIFIVFPAFEKIYNKSNKYIKILLCIIILGIFWIDTNIFIIDSVCQYIVYFLIGYLIKLYKENERIKGIVKFFKNKWTITVMLIIYVVLTYINIDMKLRILELLAALIGILCCFGIVHKIKEEKIRTILQKCGEDSLQLYLLNGFLLVVAREIFVSILKITNPILIIMMNFLTITIVGMILIEKIMKNSKVLKITSGIV